MAIKRGRPKKSEPKLILGLVGLLGSRQRIISEYLEIRYNFHVIDLVDILKTSFIDHKDNIQVFDLKTENGFRKQFDEDYWVKMALSKIHKLGRPLAIIQNIRYWEELEFFQKQKFHSVSVLAKEEDRFRSFISDEKKLDLGEFQSLDQYFSSLKGSSGIPLNRCIMKTDFRVNLNSDLGKLYERIEGMLKKIFQENEELAQILQTRKKK